MKHEERTLQTKTAIADSLKKQLKTRSLSGISVGDIVDDCSLNRKTFYYHFNDMHDLLRWILEAGVVDVVERFDMPDDLEKAIAFVLDYVDKNDYIINCALDEVGREILKSFFYDDFVRITKDFVESFAERTGKDRDSDGRYIEYICGFYTEALVGMVIEYARKPQACSREEILKYISEIVRRSIPALLG